MPETTLVFPERSVDVSVERSFESVCVALMAKSNLSDGASSNSISAPALRAFGTLNTTRDEHEPAVTVACRSLMSAKNAAALNEPRPPTMRFFEPTS